MRPLILWLEDLHWSDVSTLDLLSFLARRRQPARLLVVGTYRPMDASMKGHPLPAIKQELQLHGYCKELALRFLGERDVAAVSRGEVCHPSAAGRPGAVILPAHGGESALHGQCGGVFGGTGGLVQREGWWELQGDIEEVVVGVPQSLRQMVEQQLERLSPEEQRVVEAASVAGAEFSAAAVAAGVDAEVGEVEERCAGLVRRQQLIRARGTEEWPDGTVAARYGFIHALYHEVVYERVTGSRGWGYIGGSANERKRPMARRPERSRRSWQCTLSGDGNTAGLFSICSKRGRMPSRRSALSGGNQSSDQRVGVLTMTFRTLPNVSSKNLACKSRWAVHSPP